MEENKTTRPKYDQYPEKNHCQYEKPEYDCYKERPQHDHYPVKPEYDCYKERPKYDHCPERPKYDQYDERPKYDHCPERPKYDYYDERPKYDHCPEKPQHDCHEERPQHDCHEERDECDRRQSKTRPDNCCCPQEKKLRPNECGSCCEPVEVKCPDISCAVCTPILAEKIFDFKHIKHRVPFRLPNTTTFFVDARHRGCPCFINNAPVCIEKITVVFTCLGLGSSSISGFVCNTPITLNGSAQICNTCPSGTLEIFNNFTTTISPKCCHNEKGSSATLLLNNLNASICNYQFIVEGFIGCEPFTARAPQTPASQANFLPSPFNLFADICLPDSDDLVNLKAEFDLNYIARSIVPTSCFNSNETDDCPRQAGTFTAQIFAELLVNAKFHVTKEETLTVFSTRTEFKHHEK